jgi:hypothetical protein
MKNQREMAEFVGIMLGDGYLGYPTPWRMKISFNSVDDKEYVKIVDKLLIKLFNTKTIIKHRSNEKVSEIYIFKREILRHLVNDLDLIPSPKWERARIPDWIFKENLEKHALRGYFDTDGSVVITNNNGTRYPRLEMKVSPSPMQEQFIGIVKSLGFRHGVYAIGKGKVRIQINGKDELAKWNNIVGFSNPKHQRKCDSFFR